MGLCVARSLRRRLSQGGYGRRLTATLENQNEAPHMLKIDQVEVVQVLNEILEAELAGVVRYTHYSFLVFGFGRIPIVSWLRAQANESLLHAQQVGEWITTLGAYPSLEIGALLDSHQHDIAAVLRESLEAEGRALDLYRKLLALVEDRSVALEEFARQMIHTEELHAAEVDKMLRKPGELASFSQRQSQIDSRTR
jgi:bacterioferritin